MTTPLITPQVGSIVHYVGPAGPSGEAAGPCLAAIVTQVSATENMRVGVRVFTPVEDFFQPLLGPEAGGCVLDDRAAPDSRAPGSWHPTSLAGHLA